MKCSICYRDIDVQPYWNKGHNAEPVNFGRCCTRCNNNVVIPARIAQLSSRRADDAVVAENNNKDEKDKNNKQEAAS